MTQEPQFRQNDREKRWHHTHDDALTRLIHDVGFEIAGELVNGKPRVVDAVVSQMQNGVKPYELDFKLLGATPEQITRINAHQKERRELDEAHSDLIKAAGLEVAKELEASNPKVLEMLREQIRGGVPANDVDFKALGATDDQLPRIVEHQAARRELEQAARATYAEPDHTRFADRIGADENVHDFRTRTAATKGTGFGGKSTA